MMITRLLAITEGLAGLAFVYLCLTVEGLLLWATIFMAGILVGIGGTVYTLASKGFVSPEDQRDTRTEAYAKGFFAGVRLGLMRLVKTQ